MVDMRAKSLSAVMPDLIRYPRLFTVKAALTELRRGYRIKSGMTVELKLLYFSFAGRWLNGFFLKI